MTQPAGGGTAGVDDGHDPALDELRQNYREGNLVLFVGAGVSAAAGLPGWGQLVETVTQAAKARGAAEDVAGEIGRLAAAGKYIDALTAARDALGAPDFGAAVEAALDDRRHVPEVPEIGRAIASLAVGLRAVITTNLDHLLERAFEGRWPVLHRATADVARREGVILKLHGTLLDRSTWVMTRDGYDRAMYEDARMKEAFTAIFHACPILFAGYGLSDDDFDHLLGRVRALVGGQPPRHYALVPGAHVTPYWRKLREDAGVRVIRYAAHADVPRILRWLGAADAGAPGAPPPALVPAAFASSSAPAAEPPPSAPLPPPPDAPYDPRFYVHRREEEKRALAKLAVPGSPVVLWSPSRFGASTMLRHLVERVAEEDARSHTEALVLEADLGALLPEPPSGPRTDEAVQARVDAFLGRFAHHLLDEVRAGEAAFTALARDRAGWAHNLRFLMEDHVLPRARGRLVLVLDKADALWGEPKIQGAFYRALRVWKDQAHKPLWSKLRLVLLISTTPAVVFDDPEHRDSPFYNLTADYIELLEYTTDQVVELARMHGLGWDRDVVSREIYPLLGGHPYLLRVLMYRARLTGAPLSAFVGDDDALDRLYGAHLRELGALVERDPALRDALARVLDDPMGAIDEDRFQRLRRAGLAMRTKNGIVVPNQLYERYLRRRWQTRARR